MVHVDRELRRFVFVGLAENDAELRPIGRHLARFLHRALVEQHVQVWFLGMTGQGLSGAREDLFVSQKAEQRIEFLRFLGEGGANDADDADGNAADDGDLGDTDERAGAAGSRRKERLARDRLAVGDPGHVAGQRVRRLLLL